VLRSPPFMAPPNSLLADLLAAFWLCIALHNRKPLASKACKRWDMGSSLADRRLGTRLPLLVAMCPTQIPRLLSLLHTVRAFHAASDRACFSRCPDRIYFGPCTLPLRATFTSLHDQACAPMRRLGHSPERSAAGRAFLTGRAAVELLRAFLIDGSWELAAFVRCRPRLYDIWQSPVWPPPNGLRPRQLQGRLPAACICASNDQVSGMNFVGIPASTARAYARVHMHYRLACICATTRDRDVDADLQLELEVAPAADRTGPGVHVPVPDHALWSYS
jgi:hypothetical protein